MTSLDESIRPVIRDLVEGFSTQTKVSNRIWLTMLLPISLIFSQSEGNMRVLPFNLGELPSSQFDIAVFIILVSLIISFTSARAQSLKIYKMAHTKLDMSGGTKSQIELQRQLFGMLTHPSFVRTGPFIGLVGVKADTSTQKFKSLSVLLYLITKYVALLVVLGFPAYSLICSLLGFWCDYGILVGVVSTIFTAVAVFSLLYVFVIDAKITNKIFKMYWRG